MNKNGMNVATVLCAQYGFGDQSTMKQLVQIIAGATLLAGANSLPASARSETVTENGQHVVYLHAGVELNV